MENDKAAKEILKTAGIHFGTSMSHLVTALNPELVIVGGPLARSEPFLAAAESTLLAKSSELSRKSVKLIGSKMNDSAILGAASIII